MAKPNPLPPAQTEAPADDVTDALNPEAEAAPEPITPERALEWNRYYDRYVVGGVLLLVFLVSAHKIAATNSSIWTHLKAGEVTVRNGAPITTDVFSFSEANKPWVDIPWLYQVASHAVFSTARAYVPVEQGSSLASPGLGAQIGAGVLVGLNALARVLTVVILLRLRRPGPGAWWFAVVMLMAFGCMLAPKGTQLEFRAGGIAGQAPLTPQAWGAILLATEVLLIDRAFALGRGRALFALPALFLLWANLDDSFIVGLLILAVATVAGVLTRPRGSADRPAPGTAFGALAASFAACLLNPSLHRIYGAAFAPIVAVPRAALGVERWSFLNGVAASPRLNVAFYGIVVLLGLATFALDRRRLDVTRLAAYLVAAALWAGLGRLSTEFAVVFAWVVGLNAQAWYRDRYGVEGRISSGWTAWSVGGRCLTIGALFGAMYVTLTGYGYSVGQPTFGFGFDASEFDFEAAEYLKTSKIAGQVLNLNAQMGDALIWGAYPARKTFVDSRRGVFGDEVRRDLRDFRRAFTEEEVAAPEAAEPEEEGAPRLALYESKEDPARWRPVLDKYRASAVLFDISVDPTVYRAMLRSKNWIPIRNDGRIVLFGRADAPAEDLAIFEAERLDPAQVVFHRKETVPYPDRTPTAMTVIDRIIRTRSLTPQQRHVSAGNHWLSMGGEQARGLPDAAHCIMAIREARRAIHFNPDDTDAYRLLSVAYDSLRQNEFRAFTAKGTPPPQAYMDFRSRQLITALNFAIQTTPPPTTTSAREELANLHSTLATLYRTTGDLDFERDELAAARELDPANASPELSRRLDQLDDAIARFKDDLQRASSTPGMETAMARAGMAAQAGFTAFAIRELEDAENQGVPLDQILASLVSLYCRTGQPDKASEKLASRTADDPALYSGPGTPSYLHGLVNMLLGYYDVTVHFWRDNALKQAAFSERDQSLAITREVLFGLPEKAVSTALNLGGYPGKVGLIETESAWEFELGLCLLESGDPDGAGKAFLAALRFNPKTTARPLIEDYLKQLDVKVPDELKTPTGANAPADGAKAATDAPKDANAKPADGDAPKEEKKAEAPAEEKKSEAPKAETTPDAPDAEKKPDTPKGGDKPNGP